MRLLRNPYLKAIRNGLTLTLPLVMAGSVSVLLANFPVAAYQNFMNGLFGGNWRDVCINIYEGTFSMLAPIMLLTISFSLAEYYNSLARSRQVHPAVAVLVALGSYIALIQAYSLDSSNPSAPPGTGLPFFWLGIHGMFLAIVVAFLSTMVFYRLLAVGKLRISFFSQESDSSIRYAFSALLPGMLTIFIFALIKTLFQIAGIESINQSIYDLLSAPFTRMGNTVPTAVLYTVIRHVFWFFGIHGTNLMEPVTTSLYIPAMEENLAAVAAGMTPPNIFSKTFFDSFIAMGGAGSTICLLAAIFLSQRRGSTYKIAQISLLPALFNINEMIMFGLPIVLNPVYLVPFLLVPVLQCLLTYGAMLTGLVPVATNTVEWTAPIFISGYAATGSLAGVFMQAVNFAVGVAVYAPFVLMADNIKKKTFGQALNELFSAQNTPDQLISPEAASIAGSLMNDLAGAAKRGELFLEYQPQVECTTGKIFGVEALMRWNHPHLGRIPPGLFIHWAEETGLINELGAWALDESCRQWDEWRRNGVDDVVMSVNVSVMQLDSDLIVDQIVEAKRKYDIPPHMLEVEVTESVMVGGGRSELLRKIHDNQVLLAIDDFGMGHSSLVYLKHFPVDTIKIDRVLSKDVVESRSSAEIILSISELCKSLNIQILVEYVDNQEQLRVLRELGCTRIQGWLYSPAIQADKCLEYIKKGAPVYDTYTELKKETAS